MSIYTFYICDIGVGTKIVPYKDQQYITWDEALSLFQTNREFVSYIIAIMEQSEYPSFFWENSPVSSSQHFEFVLINAPSLLRSNPNPSPFDEFIGKFKGTNSVVFFPNIGKDAHLVVPAKNGPDDTYAHIANFIRNAPEEQKYELFRVIGFVGQFLMKSLDNFWISTSGLGVSWLHIRNDLTPKYYSYKEYK